MKKIILILAILGLSSAHVLAAKYGGFSDSNVDRNAVGGFIAPGASILIASDAKLLSVGTRVILRGKIETQSSGKQYLFRDSSGTIIVDIDNRRWKGQNITPLDGVEIEGKVDIDLDSVIIDVNRVTIIK